MNFLLYILVLIPLIGMTQKMSVTEHLHFNKNSLYEETSLFFHKGSVNIGDSIAFGNLGKGSFTGGSPYVFLNDFTKYKNYYYSQIEYSSSNRGIGIGFNIETNWSLGNNKNLLFLGIASKLFFVTDKVNITLRFPNRLIKLEELPDRIMKDTIMFHRTISSGIYMGYSYSITRNLKLEAQLNFIHYYPINTEVYMSNVSNSSKYLMVALEPNLSIGINYIIKKQ